VRAPDVRDIRRGPAPQFGMDMVEAWRAVCCLHGDDVDHWEDMDPRTVAEPGGLDARAPQTRVPGPRAVMVSPIAPCRGKQPCQAR
jgi:hypothetical protein